MKRYVVFRRCTLPPVDGNEWQDISPLYVDMNRAWSYLEGVIAQLPPVEEGKGEWEFTIREIEVADE